MRAMIRNPSILDQSARQEIMNAYDGLPPEVRIAIANANFPYDPRRVSNRISRGVRPEAIIAEIEAFNGRPQPWL